MEKNPINDVIQKVLHDMVKNVFEGVTDKLMKSVIALEEIKMNFVREQNFQDADIIRTAQNTLRDIIKDCYKEEEKINGS